MNPASEGDWAFGLCEAERLCFPGVGTGRDLIICGFFLKGKVNGNVLNRLTGQCFADYGTKLGGDHLLIGWRKRQHDIVGARESSGQCQNAERYSQKPSHNLPRLPLWRFPLSKSKVRP